MDKARIVVDVVARINWQRSPKDKDEEIMREHAKVMVAAAGKKLEIAVQLLVAELLNAQVHNERQNGTPGGIEIDLPQVPDREIHKPGLDC